MNATGSGQEGSPFVSGSFFWCFSRFSTNSAGSLFRDFLCMKRLQPYLAIFCTLALNLLGLCYRVVRQLVLPGRRRSGNLLSSLFLLFAGLTEQLINCRQALLRLPWTYTGRIPARSTLIAAWLYSKRYIRLGMLIATWALFILASLEWSGPEQPPVAPANAQSATIAGRESRSEPAVVSTRAVPTRAVPTRAVSPRLTKEYPSPVATEETACRPAYTIALSQPVAAKRWLLLRTLRI